MDECILIIEVNKEDRIRCEYPSCSHLIYKAIHTLRSTNGDLTFIGSSCFKKMISKGTAQKIQRNKPHALTVSTPLTVEERDQLLINRKKLVELILKKHEPAELIIAIETTDTPPAISKRTFEHDPSLYPFLRRYIKFNPKIDYSSFPIGEKKSRALDMVTRRLRDAGINIDKYSKKRFSDEVSDLIKDMEKKS